MQKIIILFSLVIGLVGAAEHKYGIGKDVLGGQAVYRVVLENFIDKVRIEPRFNYSNVNDTNTGGTSDITTSFGLGGYYDLNKFLSAGGFIDFGAFSVDGVSASTSTTLAAVIKVEQEIMKYLSVAFEVGIQNASSKATNFKSINTLSETYAVTLRIFF